MGREQVERFLASKLFLQKPQMEFCAAARDCDKPDGPTAILTGGARGGGKTTAMIGQIAIDDCQRVPNLKWLWLRKVGKANIEQLNDIRRTILRFTPHSFRQNDGTIVFPNKSRIICGHYHNESDIDAYLGLEYDGIGIEEATTLQESKYRNIRTCLRSSKRGWRPREYLTANPGGIGHGHIKRRFIDPYRSGKQVETRFIPSQCVDNAFNNPGYIKVLQSMTGWQRRAWLEGDWDITAGQFFTNWREDKHVIDRFDDRRAVRWCAALDYGYCHYTVALLAAITGDGQMIVVDEHAFRERKPEWHVPQIREMLARHGILSFSELDYFVAGGDIFGVESNGSTVAGTYASLGMPLTITECWNDRVNGWAEIIRRLGDPDNKGDARLLITRNCRGLIERMPLMQHDENRPEDVMKVDCDPDTGEGGDDHPDVLRYLTVSYRGNPVVTHAAALVVGGYRGGKI